MRVASKVEFTAPSARTSAPVVHYEPVRYTPPVRTMPHEPMARSTVPVHVDTVPSHPIRPMVAEPVITHSAPASAAPKPKPTAEPVVESGVNGAPVKLKQEAIEVLDTPCRICPVTRTGPLSINCSNFEILSSTTFTKTGALRDKVQFWKHFREKYDTAFPEIWSEANLRDLASGKAPKVDSSWLKYFPEHAKYVGEGLEHHHINHGNIAIPLPLPMHRKGLFHKMNHDLETFIKEVAE